MAEDTIIVMNADTQDMLTEDIIVRIVHRAIMPRHQFITNQRLFIIHQHQEQVFL